DWLRGVAKTWRQRLKQIGVDVKRTVCRESLEIGPGDLGAEQRLRKAEALQIGLIRHPLQRKPGAVGIVQIEIAERVDVPTEGMRQVLIVTGPDVAVIDAGEILEEAVRKTL